MVTIIVITYLNSETPKYAHNEYYYYSHSIDTDCKACSVNAQDNVRMIGVEKCMKADGRLRVWTEVETSVCLTVRLHLLLFIDILPTDNKTGAHVSHTTIDGSMDGKKDK